MLTFAIIAFAIFSMQIFALTWRAKKRRLCEQASDEVLSDNLAIHKDILREKYKTLVTYDAYGNADYRKFMEELAHFVDKVIVRDLKAKKIDTRPLATPKYARIVINKILASVMADQDS